MVVFFYILGILVCLLVLYMVLLAPFSWDNLTVIMIFGALLVAIVFQLVRRLKRGRQIVDYAQPILPGQAVPSVTDQPAPTFGHARVIVIATGIFAIFLGGRALLGALRDGAAIDWQIVPMVAGLVFIFFGWRIGRNKDHAIRRNWRM